MTSSLVKHTFLNPGDEIDFKVIALTPHQVTCVFNPQKSQITIKIDNDSLVTEADFEVSYSFKKAIQRQLNSFELDVSLKEPFKKH